MRRFADALVRFLEREDGPTAVEYAVMLAFIIVICVVAIATLGSNTNGSFANPTLQNAVSSSS
jgi:pilus assembly protein Flp/PilA